MPHGEADLGHSSPNRPTNGHRNILIAATHGVAGFIRTMGGCPELVFGRIGIDERILDHPNRTMDLGAYVAMMEEAARDTDQDNFGLEFGQIFQPEMLGLIGGIALASPTLGAALENLARYFPLHQQATETRFHRDGPFLRLEYRILDGGLLARRQDAELTLGMFANVIRAALGPSWTPEETQYEHPRPADWRRHEAAFGAPAHFGQRTNALVFRDRDLARRMPAGDLGRLTRLCDTLTRIAGGVANPPLLDRVRAEVRARLSDGPPRVDDIADGLGIARWTLQRRLADDGMTFSDLVETTRRDLAALYLRHRHVPISDIADLLGYSEPSAFSRACRRWFDAAPTTIRAMAGVIETDMAAQPSSRHISARP